MLPISSCLVQFRKNTSPLVSLMVIKVILIKLNQEPIRIDFVFVLYVRPIYPVEADELPTSSHISQVSRISSLDILIDINVINKVNATFRIKMIVFPRYKIPQHYKFQDFSAL